MLPRQGMTARPRPLDGSPVPPPGPGSFQQTVRAYGSPAVWTTLVQQLAYHRHWMQAAAIAYGLAFCLLLVSLGMLAAISLSPRLATTLLTALQYWNPTSVEPTRHLIQETAAIWSPTYSWCLCIFSGGMALILGLALVGTVQRNLRTSGMRPMGTPRPCRQRLGTVFILMATGLLMGLAFGLVFAATPARSEGAIATTSLWGRGQFLIIQGLRWSLALSTMSLLCGLFYRFSMSPYSPRQPILPGTALATVIWAAPTLLVKGHFGALQQYHWLYGLLSSGILILLGLYLGTIGLLMGGHFNTLIRQTVQSGRSQLHPTHVPTPPSFESFEIRRRSDRRG